MSNNSNSDELPISRFEEEDEEEDDEEEDESESDEEEEEDEDESEIVENEDEGNELVVLDPDHPLMMRFQASLKTMLLKQLERSEIENRETTEAVKKKKNLHLELGNELYAVQQELAKNQMQLEQVQEKFHSAQEHRSRQEELLQSTRANYRDTQQQYNVEIKKMIDLRQKLDDIALRVFYVSNAKEDLKNDIAVMRRAAEKGDADMSKIEEQKMKQDLLVDRLTDRVDRLREEIALYEAQIVAQTEEKETCKQTLREAQTEIDAIRIERKQLSTEWNSSLIGLQRRNEAYAAMLKTLNEKQEMVVTINAEMAGYQKSISKEQELNEKLTMILNRAESDAATLKKVLAQIQVKHEALKQEYSTYSRMMHETESALLRANGDKAAREQEVDTLRKQIEKEYLAKVKLEDQISEEMRSRLTMQKAAEYTNRLVHKLRDHTRSMDTQFAVLENNISADSLKIAENKAEIHRLKKMVNETETDIREKNDVINKLETEISRNVINIERKQKQVDLLNKKLEQLIENAGGVELGPLELTIKNLNKSIQGKLEEIGDLEQTWLRDQQELVREMNEKEDLTQTVNRLRKQLTILNQKKMRIEGDIEAQIRETKTTERELRHLQNDMVKLNKLIFHESDQQEEISKKNSLIETDFVLALKEMEIESLNMKTKCSELREEKERLLNELVETERHIMLWEKKIQLAQETRSAVDSDIGQGEIKAMKSEIHRMEVRHSQLMRQQEKLIQDMEKSVSRRDTIMTRGEAEGKIKKKVQTKGSVQKDIADLKKRIRESIHEANNNDDEMHQMEDTLTALKTEISSKQLSLNEIQEKIDSLNNQLTEQMEAKRMCILDLNRRQQMARNYTNLKDGKYNRFCRGQVSREMERQYNRLQSLGHVVDQIMAENPTMLASLQTLRTKVDEYLNVFETTNQ